MERTRRLRMNERVRDMVRENHVRVDELIYPIFVIEGENICEPVESMPGICQYSIDRLHEELDRVREAGIPAVLLFGIPAHKDEQEVVRMPKTESCHRRFAILRKLQRTCCCCGCLPV